LETFSFILSGLATNRPTFIDISHRSGTHFMVQQHRSDHRPPPRVFEYRLPQGWLVMAGRTDEDNDHLSLRMAAPNDWWFHVRGQPGSHVILRVPSDQDPNRSILKLAAAIAAYHSKARQGGVVPVSATRARYVTKPPGAKPGTVQIRKEIVLKVRPALPVDPD
jgi:predicted ribosome quality control (RQC) complex YloA/Tae2 family protein